MANLLTRVGDFLGLTSEKINPSQPYIREQSGTNIPSQVDNYYQYYNSLGIVNRVVNMVVDGASQIDVIVDTDKIPQQFKVVKNSKRASVDRILNFEPNPFQDISMFRRQVMTDLFVEGNAFIYYDGAHIYHLPAALVEIEPDEKLYVKSYKVKDIHYDPEEIIHVKDNSLKDIYRGASRLKGTLRNMNLLARLLNFQDNFFINGAVPGLVLKSENTLSEKLKERMIEGWLRAYAPNKGGKRPLILDGGLELDTISNTNFRELDFENSVINQESAIAKNLGVPPILLDGGNNANIRPNQRLFYTETVVPFVDKFLRAFERYFGFKLSMNKDVAGLQPELKEQASFYTTLVNGGIISVNEARKGLSYDEMSGEDDLRVPANIAGSAVNPDEGGRPSEEDDEE